MFLPSVCCVRLIIADVSFGTNFISLIIAELLSIFSFASSSIFSPSPIVIIFSSLLNLEKFPDFDLNVTIGTKSLSLYLNCVVIFFEPINSSPLFGFVAVTLIVILDGVSSTGLSIILPVPSPLFTIL